MAIKLSISAQKCFNESITAVETCLFCERKQYVDMTVGHVRIHDLMSNPMITVRYTRPSVPIRSQHVSELSEFITGEFELQSSNLINTLKCENLFIPVTA